MKKKRKIKKKKSCPARHEEISWVRARLVFLRHIWSCLLIIFTCQFIQSRSGMCVTSNHDWCYRWQVQLVFVTPSMTIDCSRINGGLSWIYSHECFTPRSVMLIVIQSGKSSSRSNIFKSLFFSMWGTVWEARWIAFRLASSWIQRRRFVAESLLPLLIKTCTTRHCVGLSTFGETVHSHW